MPKAELRELSTLEDLEAVLDRSRERPQLLFKHSLTCPVSGAAHAEVRGYLEREPAEGTDYWLIAVQRARPVSNAVAERVAVRHESPQAILVSGEKAVWNASHWEITGQALARALNGA